jgi:hypothetical protein
MAMLRQQQKSSSISGHVYGDNCENDSGGQRHRSDEYHRPVRVNRGERQLRRLPQFQVIAPKCESK